MYTIRKVPNICIYFFSKILIKLSIYRNFQKLNKSIMHTKQEYFFNWRISPPMNKMSAVTRCQRGHHAFRATMTSDEDNEHLHDVFCYLHLIISKDWQVTKRFPLSVLRFFRALLAIRGPGADELKKAARCEIWQAATRKQIFSHHQTILGITGMLSHFMAMSLEQKIRK